MSRQRLALIGRPTTTKKKAATNMKTGKSGAAEGQGGDTPSQLIDGRIKEERRAA